MAFALASSGRNGLLVGRGFLRSRGLCNNVFFIFMKLETGKYAKCYLGKFSREKTAVFWILSKWGGGPAQIFVTF